MIAADHPARLGSPVPVVFISSHATRGGAESYLARLLERLGPEWIRSVISLKEGPFAEVLQTAGYPLEVVDTGPRSIDIVQAARRVRRSLLCSRPAVVHANGVKAALVAVLATPGTGIPVIWVKHDVSRDGWLANLVARRCAAVIGVSSTVTETFGPRLRDRVTVIHTQIPEPIVDQTAARATVLELFAPSHPRTVVTLVGRLDPFKGHAELVGVLPELVSNVPGLKLLFVGGDDDAHPGYEGRLQQQVASTGCNADVVFTGHRDDAIELVAGSDIVAVPSVADSSGMGKEGFPYVGLEALAVGTPLIGYAHGGLVEMVGPCAVLVPPGDRHGLARAIVELTEDAERRDQLALCGRARFETLFKWTTLGQDLAERYRTVAKAAKRP